MANIKSAEKRHAQSLKRRARNLHWRSTVKTAMKKAREAAATNDPAKATAAFRDAEKTLMKAATKGIIHSRNASRHVSRLNKLLATVAQ